MAMHRPANPEPMIATPTSRTALDPAGAGWLASVLVTDRLLEVVGPGLLSNAQQATTVTEQRSIRARRRDRGAPMSILRRSRPRTPLAGRTVLITGAARGIGAELARKAAARG